MPATSDSQTRFIASAAVQTPNPFIAGAAVPTPNPFIAGDVALSNPFIAGDLTLKGMDPHRAGPSIGTVLTRQPMHRSSLLWDAPLAGEEVYDWFSISFDKFGRTSTPQQTEICQAIFNKILENNWLSENSMQQLYCDTCKRFLADRLVEGTCPKEVCNYQSARGDQCENCGSLLNPTELKDPRCKVCQTTPHIRDTNHLFLELPLLKDKLEEYINKMSVAGSWSQNAIQTTNAWLKEGLKSRCITRDLKWGVPVPLERFSDKVFYVWFDAPIGYVSITACHTPEWEKWWKNPEDVELYQFMGKDNVPFHTVRDGRGTVVISSRNIVGENSWDAEDYS
ncbi:hypothetical protein CMV_005037 [Castanea mollissima]|uniref:methionine--tRNA ligase n=1 Tax=Castanea mollissima TaxID=60419 RepID=A0A8J4REE0_9ROSI|nr:hypothetical protein CMV_005037 [Castanea mollissima]